MSQQQRIGWTGFVIAVLCIGCTTSRTTNTSRTALEQLLISSAVDETLDEVDFTPFAGQAVLLQDKYIDCVDKNYVVASLRHRLFASGARLVDSLDEAEVVVEARVGGVGTDSSDMFVGVPQIAAPGPLPLQVPEIRLITRSTQVGTAKIGLVAYDAETKQALMGGGTSLSQADDQNWYVLGAGPFNRGKVRRQVKAAESHAGHISFGHTPVFAIKEDKNKEKAGGNQQGPMHASYEEPAEEESNKPDSPSNEPASHDWWSPFDPQRD